LQTEVPGIPSVPYRSVPFRTVPTGVQVATGSSTVPYRTYRCV